MTLPQHYRIFFPLAAILVCALTVGMPWSADLYFQGYASEAAGSRGGYLLMKLLHHLVVGMLLARHTSALKSTAIMTSPVVIALLSREGLDFLSIASVLVLLAPNVYRVIYLALLTLVFTAISEPGLVFVTICAAGLLLILNMRSFSLQAGVILAFLLAGVGYASNSFEIAMSLVELKISQKTEANLTNIDFSLPKAFLVLILSHTYFIYADSANLMFATVTAPLYLLLFRSILSKDMILPLGYCALTFIATTTYFYTFQHLRLYPFIFFLYFVKLSDDKLPPIIIANAVIFLLFVVWHILLGQSDLSTTTLFELLKFQAGEYHI